MRIRLNCRSSPEPFVGFRTGSQKLVLQLAGTPNYPCLVQMATNLTPPVTWQSILTNPADVNSHWGWTNSNPSVYPAGFYRAAAGP